MNMPLEEPLVYPKGTVEAIWSKVGMLLLIR
ncbi:hypothetical protein ES708_17686 [subsurface metagenome]